MAKRLIGSGTPGAVGMVSGVGRETRVLDGMVIIGFGLLLFAKRQRHWWAGQATR